MKRKAAFIICLIISIVTLLQGASFSLAADAGKTEEEKFRDLANWQGDLDPDTPITEVNTPGTHDSAMFGIGSALWDGAGFAHNQDKTFAEQLSIGVRYIDGRFCYVNKKNADETENIFCCHGGFIPEMNDKDISLKDLLGELNKFLDEHPTEYIFLPYKCESEKDMTAINLNQLLTQIFWQLSQDNDERYMIAYAGDRVPTVEEAKGHIIFSINSNSGIFSDHVSIANTYSDGTDKKVKELSSAFDINNVRKLSKEPKKFSLNSGKEPESDRVPRLIHTSCYQAPFRTPAWTSKDIREWLFGRVDKLDDVAPPTFYEGYYYGIVLFDYVKADECRLIVSLNRKTGKRVNLADVNNVYVSTFEEIKTAIKEIPEYGSLRLYLNKPEIKLSETITIDKPCDVYFYASADSCGCSLTVPRGRAFYIDDEDVGLHFGGGITLCGYSDYEGDGECIYVNDDNCLIEGAVFSRCGSKNTDNGLFDNWDGGAIYVNGTDCTIRNCTFEYCKAQSEGGAICIDEDDCRIEYCRFLNCTAADGGALYFSPGVDDCFVEQCLFRGCTAGNTSAGDINGRSDTYVIDCNGCNSIKGCSVKTKNGFFEFGYNKDGTVGLCASVYKDGKAHGPTEYIKSAEAFQKYIKAHAADEYDFMSIDLKDNTVFPLGTLDISEENVKIQITNGYIDGRFLGNSPAIGLSGAGKVTFDMEGLHIQNAQSGIHVTAPDCMLKSGTVYNCKPLNGGIYIEGNGKGCRIESVRLIECDSQDKGAISSTCDNTTITGCKFENCGATSKYDVAFSGKGNVIEKCEFTPQKARIKGDCKVVNETASIFSDASLWIIIGTVVVVVAAVVVAILAEKKKKAEKT